MSDNKINVLHLELDEHLGGIESFLYNLYSAVDRDRINFDFVSRFDNPALKSEFLDFGAKIYKVSSLKHPFKYMCDMEKIISEGSYDIIHIHKNSAANILPFLIVKKYKGIKVFVHSHNTRPSVNGISYMLHKINRRILWKNSDEHFACSEVAGKWLFGNKHKFDIVKNGINIQKFEFDNNKRENKRAEFSINDDDLVIGNVGRFTEQKNQKRLIDIFTELKKSVPNAWLLLVGDGELRKELEQYVSDIALNNVIFAGVRRDISELMMAMDIFVMPSLYEGLPIVGIEAQATGLKMLVSDTVSSEIKIINQFQWFSLEDENCEIIKKIIKMEQDNSANRNIANSIVSDSGFNMKNTANYIMEKYEKL